MYHISKKAVEVRKRKCEAGEAPRRACPLCGEDRNTRDTLAYSQPPWKLKKCGRCELVFLENPPGNSHLEDTFAWERTSQRERQRRREGSRGQRWLKGLAEQARKALRRESKSLRFIRDCGAGGAFLDVGCGAGVLLANLPGGWKPYGIEVSRVLAAAAYHRVRPHGGQVVQGPASEAVEWLPHNFFDCVLMRSFLEHDLFPGTTLSALRRVLKPGGSMIVKVPNFASWNRVVRGKQWCGFRFPDHVNYFTPKTITRLLASRGFAIIRSRYVDRLPTSDNLWLVARRNSGFPGARHDEAEK